MAKRLPNEPDQTFSQPRTVV